MIDSAMKERVAIANDKLMPEIAKLLSQGCEVTIRAKGRSMSPYIRDGKDNLIFKAVDPASLKIGDVVLAKCDNTFLAHRIIRMSGDKLLLKGDGNINGTETCRKHDVIGKLIYVEKNGKRIDCYTPSELRKAAIGRTIRRSYLRLRHSVAVMLRLR